jgi:hypothetical protein
MAILSFRRVAVGAATINRSLRTRPCTGQVPEQGLSLRAVGDRSGKSAHREKADRNDVAI